MPGQFVIQPQERSEWCWAAVAVSIERYFDPQSALTQCAIANAVLGSEKVCCQNGSGCNEAATLISALQQINRLKRILTRPLTFPELQRELDAGLPVCARIRWKGGHAHFIVLVGYRVLPPRTQHVDVEDPFNPSGTVAFDTLRDAYYGNGEWIDTYLVTPSSKNWNH
jgi:hypothetical protein